MKPASIWKALCVTAMTCTLISAADAAGIRTFISGVGNDSNSGANCPRATPCRTLATAYGVTSAGGEIVAIDPAGYGPITITGPISLIGVQGATIAVASSSTGVTINAGASDKIFISDFIISGAGASSTIGIAQNTGVLTLRESVLKALTIGLVVSSTHSDVIATDFVANATAIQTNGTGVSYNSGVGEWIGSGVTEVRINGGSLIDNPTAFNENNPGATSGNASATIWCFTPGTSISTNLTGYTTLMTVTGTGSGNGIPGPQTYSGTGAPN